MELYRRPIDRLREREGEKERLVRLLSRSSGQDFRLLRSTGDFFRVSWFVRYAVQLQQICGMETFVDSSRYRESKSHSRTRLFHSFFSVFRKIRNPLSLSLCSIISLLFIKGGINNFIEYFFSLKFQIIRANIDYPKESFFRRISRIIIINNISATKYRSNL